MHSSSSAPLPAPLSLLRIGLRGVGRASESKAGLEYTNPTVYSYDTWPHGDRSDTARDTITEDQDVWEARMGRESIGELEHLILLTIAALREEASALGIRRRLEAEGRGLSRGALYRSLDRLGEKSLIEWAVDEPEAARGGHPRRVYRLSLRGTEVIQERRATLESLWADAAEALR